MYPRVRDWLWKLALIYGREPMHPEACDLYFELSGMADEKAFVQRLIELVRADRRWPLPADFQADGEEGGGC